MQQLAAVGASSVWLGNGDNRGHAKVDQELDLGPVNGEPVLQSEHSKSAVVKLVLFPDRHSHSHLMLRSLIDLAERRSTKQSDRGHQLQERRHCDHQPIPLNGRANRCTLTSGGLQVWRIGSTSKAPSLLPEPCDCHIMLRCPALTHNICIKASVVQMVYAPFWGTQRWDATAVNSKSWHLCGADIADG